LLDGKEGKVAEVLVIDRIELIEPHQLIQMRELHRNHAVRREQDTQPLDEVVQIGHVREHIVAYHQVGQAVSLDDFSSSVRPEELRLAGDTLLDGYPGNVGRRLDAEHRYPLRQEML